jgi:DNA helicase-2/ATP-dependent DNA helicase PcrA
MLDLSILNENQKEAVNWCKGPLLVLAGPGNGKTMVITYRIARILTETDGRSFRILGLTFTNKAAIEMSKRVENLIPSATNRVLISTFHSFASEIMHQHGGHIKIPPDFKILVDDTDRISILDDIIKDLYSNTHDFPPHNIITGYKILPIINRLLDNFISQNDAAEINTFNTINLDIDLCYLYKKYLTTLRQLNYLHFPSLLYETLALFNKNPFIPNLIRKIYKHILIDEFQDTNLSQYIFLTSLVKPDPSTLFAVADDDQVIYQWNAANPSRIKSLQDDFNVSELQLPENYRCPPLVIQMSNSLIEKNHSRYVGKKPLTSVKCGDYSSSVKILYFNTLED